MAFLANSSITVDTNRNFASHAVSLSPNSYFAVRSPPTVMGSILGYSSGGFSPSFYNQIERFQFAADSASGLCVGALSQSRGYASGQSSKLYGYTTGGLTSPTTIVNTVDKFPFVNPGTATSVGCITIPASYTTGHSACSFGYSTTGWSPTCTPSILTNINKFPFAADTNATNIGSITTKRYYAAGQSSFNCGYVSGGYTSPGVPGEYGGSIDSIEKFSFITDNNGATAGSLTAAKYLVSGQSSLTHGYTSGGLIPGYTCVKEKFTFANETINANVGNLIRPHASGAGQSSLTHGYVSGGSGSSPVANDACIEKFPFANESTCINVGALSVARRGIAGQQY